MSTGSQQEESSVSSKQTQDRYVKVRYFMFLRQGYPYIYIYISVSIYAPDQHGLPAGREIRLLKIVTGQICKSQRFYVRDFMFLRQGYPYIYIYRSMSINLYLSTYRFI